MIRNGRVKFGLAHSCLYYGSAGYWEKYKFGKERVGAIIAISSSGIRRDLVICEANEDVFSSALTPARENLRLRPPSCLNEGAKFSVSMSNCKYQQCIILRFPKVLLLLHEPYVLYSRGEASGRPLTRASHGDVQYVSLF